MPTLTILGNGEAFDARLPNTSLLYQGTENVLIDCGFAGVQSLWQRSMDQEFLDAVLITHHHADHTFGMPALLMVMLGAKGPDPMRPRQKPLTIIGPVNTREYITMLMELAYAPGMTRLPFPVYFVECAPGETIPFGTLTIKTAAPNHSAPVLSTRWELDGKCLFAYSGDGKVTPATRALFKGTPILIHECYALPGQEGPIHTNIQTVLEVATEAGARILIPIHTQDTQRQLVLDYVREQHIYSGQVLVSDGTMSLQLG